MGVRPLLAGGIPATEPTRLGAVWADILRHPYEHLVCRWNWKSGLTSAVLRGSIFFFTNLSAGREAAVGALLTEFCYRTLLSGVIGAVTEALRGSRPQWAATLTASVALPAFSHAVEFTIHTLRGTPRVGTSVRVSIAFSVLTVLFNLYAMRRGVLLVRGGRQSLARDFAMMPGVLAGFVLEGPWTLWRLLRGAWPR